MSPFKDLATISLGVLCFESVGVPAQWLDRLEGVSRASAMRGFQAPTSSFENLARPLGAVGQGQGDNLIVLREFDLTE